MRNLSALFGSIVTVTALLGTGACSNDNGSDNGSAGMPSSGGAPGSGGMGGAPDPCTTPTPPVPPSNCADFPSLAKGDGSFTVSSTAFTSCMPIPAENTCDAKPFPQGTSFPIKWTAGPSGTMSYAVLFKDLAVIGRNNTTCKDYNKGFHYAMWDIPATVTELPANMMGGHLSTEVPGALQWSNFNNYAFFGPCPNFDPNTPTDYNDTYAVVVYALPFAKATIAAPQMGISPVRQLDDMFMSAALAVAEYRGTSSAHSSGIPDGVLPPTALPPCPADMSLAADKCIADH